MIDLKKKYKTKNGLKVVLHTIDLKNSCGKNATYPVKGTIIFNETGRWGNPKTQYMIWSIDGITDLVCGKYSELDLVEVK